MSNYLFEANNLNYCDMIFYDEIKIEKMVTTFIVGQSGCGKSTFLKLLNATQSFKSGEIIYNSKSINEVDTLVLRKEILLVSQTVFLFNESVKENFANFYKYRNLDVPDDETMKRYLDLCCCDFELSKDCTTMSGGERQRVYMAIFLSFMPKVLLLDEPTSALDNVTGEKLIANIKKFCESNGITLIVVSHDKQLTERFADKIIDIGGKQYGKDC